MGCEARLGLALSPPLSYPSLSPPFLLSLFLFLPLRLSPCLSLPFLSHRRVPSAVSYLAVVGRANARCPVCVFVSLAPSLGRATSAACPRLFLFSPLSDVRTRVVCLRLCCSCSASRSRHLCLACAGCISARFHVCVFLALAPFLRVTSCAGRGLCSRRAQRTTRSPASVVAGKGGGRQTGRRAQSVPCVGRGFGLRGGYSLDGRTLRYFWFGREAILAVVVF